MGEQGGNMQRRAWLQTLFVGAASAALTAQAKTKPVSDCPQRGLRDELNVGYSLLYEQVDGLSKLKWIVWLKHDTETFEHTVKPIIGYYANLAAQLENLPKLYPAVRIDLKAMPEFLGKARENMVNERIKEITPIVGETGTPYERTVLLMLMYALEEQNQVARAMIEKEPEPSLAKFLRQTQQGLGEHLRQVNALLERKYFARGAPAHGGT
jgi:hypothetical protein